MNTYSVKVIDGPLPSSIWESPEREPDFSTRPEPEEVLRELMAREPIFHRPEFGTTREDFDRMMAPDFWEVTASGRRISREFVLNLLPDRYKHSTEVIWEIADFHCQEIAADNFLVTYTLIQGPRKTHRATIWRRSPIGWQIVYHQGTAISPASTT